MYENHSPKGEKSARWGSKMASWTCGGLSGARWAPVGRQCRSEADFGRLLGASVSWGRLGASWAAPLGSPPGGLLASREVPCGAVWVSFSGGFGKTRIPRFWRQLQRNSKLLLPRGSKIESTWLQNRIWARLGADWVPLAPLGTIWTAEKAALAITQGNNGPARIRKPAGNQRDPRA